MFETVMLIVDISYKSCLRVLKHTAGRTYTLSAPYTGKGID